MVSPFQPAAPASGPTLLPAPNGSVRLVSLHLIGRRSGPPPRILLFTIPNLENPHRATGSRGSTIYGFTTPRFENGAISGITGSLIPLELFMKEGPEVITVSTISLA